MRALPAGESQDRYLEALYDEAIVLRDVAGLDVTADMRSAREVLPPHRSKASIHTKLALLDTLKGDLQMEAITGWNPRAPDESTRVGGGNMFRVTYQGQPVVLRRFGFNLAGSAAASIEDRDVLAFRREACILQHCASHPNIMRMLGANVREGIMLCELALCSLHTLIYERSSALQLLPPHFRFCFAFKASVVLDVASALYFLHAHDIVHRDLRPISVLLVMSPPTTSCPDPTLVAKVSNFGAAIGLSVLVDAAGNPFSPVRHQGGETEYVAPEILRPTLNARPFTAAADIYSLGVLANELFSEQPPWKGLGRSAIVANVLKLMTPELFRPDRADPLQCRVVGEVVGNAGTGCLSSVPNMRPTAKRLCADNGVLRSASARASFPATGAPASPQASRPAPLPAPIPVTRTSSGRAGAASRDTATSPGATFAGHHAANTKVTLRTSANN
jgi:serine/threonine protein kinase